jgi:hypothetical protein
LAGWKWKSPKEGKGATGERRGRGETVKERKETFFTVVKGIYTLTTRSLRARSGISGKPGVFGPTLEIPLPRNPASRFSRNLIFV